MNKVKVELVKYDMTKTKNRKRKDMLVENRSEGAVIDQLERIHKGEQVIKIHEIIWGAAESSGPRPEVFTGVVKFFDQEKGFGFIRPDEDMDELFFHQTACTEGVPADRERVEFEISKTPKGFAAIRVKAIQTY